MVFTNAESFTPTWTGFGVGDEPTGDLNFLDLGTHAMVWAPDAKIGVSNSTQFQMGGIPEAIRPSSTMNMVILANRNDTVIEARAQILTDGTAAFYTSGVSTYVVYSSVGWNNPGNKGLLVGTIFFYPL